MSSVTGSLHHWRTYTRQRWGESSVTTNLWPELYPSEVTLWALHR
jgi:hypothetical protein